MVLEYWDDIREGHGHYKKKEIKKRKEVESGFCGFGEVPFHSIPVSPMNAGSYTWWEAKMSGSPMSL